MRAVIQGHGGAVMAKQTLLPEAYQQLGRDIEALVSQHDRGSGDRVAVDNEYLLIMACEA
jgi:hypothetical protein